MMVDRKQIESFGFLLEVRKEINKGDPFFQQGPPNGLLNLPRRSALHLSDVRKENDE